MTREQELIKEFEAAMNAPLSERDKELMLSVLKWADNHPAWINVKDELPKGSHEDSHFSKDTLAVVCGVVYKGFYMPIRDRWVLDGCHEFPKVTHWIYLPNLPEED